jgi:hypothetical protein
MAKKEVVMKVQSTRCLYSKYTEAGEADCILEKGHEGAHDYGPELKPTTDVRVVKMRGGVEAILGLLTWADSHLVEIDRKCVEDYLRAILGLLTWADSHLVEIDRKCVEDYLRTSKQELRKAIENG